ncbi:MAG TPA: hypothetical protein PKH51_02425, partial [Candidatus Sumerlaeota bacterium]|nr:hypothetical protein [Candidatus Sumerlaeota bacterium]
MPIFQYVARGADGKTVNGTAEAPDQGSIMRMLREKGLTATQITASTAKAAAPRKRRGVRACARRRIH